MRKFDRVVFNYLEAHLQIHFNLLSCRLNRHQFSDQTMSFLIMGWEPGRDQEYSYVGLPNAEILPYLKPPLNNS